MDLSEAKGWVERFLDVDAEAHRGQRAQLRDPLCAPSVSNGLAHLPSPNADLETRRLFRLDRHAPLPYITAIVSEPTRARKGGEKYALRLWILDEAPAPQVVAVDDVCTACVALGVDGQDQPCIECDGVGWERWFGQPHVPITARSSESLRCYRPKTNLYLDAWRLP